jgi:hypothetical protein
MREISERFLTSPQHPVRRAALADDGPRSLGSERPSVISGHNGSARARPDGRSPSPPDWLALGRRARHREDRRGEVPGDGIRHGRPHPLTNEQPLTNWQRKVARRTRVEEGPGGCPTRRPSRPTPGPEGKPASAVTKCAEEQGQAAAGAPERTRATAVPLGSSTFRPSRVRPQQPEDHRG